MELKKIEQLIKEKNILPRDCVYHTWRDLKNGKIRILVLKDNIARCEYICPSCKNYGYQEVEWKRPFSLRCSCGFLIRVPRMREEFKREMKRK